MAKTLDQVRCRHCGYQWFPRTEGHLPRACPNCKRRNWEKKP